MTTAELIVTLGGLAVIGGIAWFFWGPRPRGADVLTSASGRQEATVLVKGGYTPDTIVAQAGRPLRLTFMRQESASCSEMVLFPDFGRSAQLPEGETVTIDLDPDEPGEYEFSCQMGMLRGKLVVR